MILGYNLLNVAGNELLHQIQVVLCVCQYYNVFLLEMKFTKVFVVQDAGFVSHVAERLVVFSCRLHVSADFGCWIGYVRLCYNIVTVINVAEIE